MPLYGRRIDEKYMVEEHHNVYSWQDCGRACHEHKTCLSWTWNTPVNEQHDGVGHICQFSAEMNQGVRNPDWIAGSISVKMFSRPLLVRLLNEVMRI